MLSRLLYNFYSLSALPVTAYYSIIRMYFSRGVIPSLINTAQKYWICFAIIRSLLKDFLTFHVVSNCYNLIKILQVEIFSSVEIFHAWCLFQAAVFHVFLNYKRHDFWKESFWKESEGKISFAHIPKKLDHFLYAICFMHK